MGDRRKEHMFYVTIPHRLFTVKHFLRRLPEVSRKTDTCAGWDVAYILGTFCGKPLQTEEDAV